MARKESKVGEGQRLKTSLQWLIALAALGSSWQAPSGLVCFEYDQRGNGNLARGLRSAHAHFLPFVW